MSVRYGRRCPALWDQPNFGNENIFTVIPDNARGTRESTYTLPACTEGGDGSKFYPCRLWRHDGEVYWMPLYKWYTRGDNGGFAVFDDPNAAQKWVIEMTRQNGMPTRFVGLDEAPYTWNKPYIFDYEYPVMHVERLKAELAEIFTSYECTYKEKYLFNYGRGTFKSYSPDVVERLAILRRKYIITSLSVSMPAENIEGTLTND